MSNESLGMKVSQFGTLGLLLIVFWLLWTQVDGVRSEMQAMRTDLNNRIDRHIDSVKHVSTVSMEEDEITLEMSDGTLNEPADGTLNEPADGMLGEPDLEEK